MRRLFVSPDGPEVNLVKNMLEDAGVPCVIRNEQISEAMPLFTFDPELWVVNDEDFPKAVEIYHSWQHPASEGQPPWVCATCGEKSPSQFSSCWKCGTERGVAA